MHQFDFSLIEALDLVFPPILTEVETLPDDLRAVSLYCRRAFGPFSQGPAAIVARFHDLKPGDPTFVNTCYSVVGEDFGISVAAVYSLDDATNTIEPIKGAGGLSPANASPEVRKREVSYAHSWFRNVINDMME